MSYIKVYGIHGRPGYANIQIGYAFGASPLEITVQKALQEGPYLAADGTWQPSPTLFTPLDVRVEGKATLLEIGPDIVDHIVEDERIRIGIPKVDFHGEAIWSNVAPSSGRIGQSVFAARAASAATSPVTPPPPPAEPTVAPEIEKPGATLPPPFEPVPPRDRRYLWAGLALLLLVVGLAGLAAWHYSGKPSEVADATLARLGLAKGGPAASTPAGPDTASPLVRTPQAPASAGPVDLQRTLTEAREMMAGNGDSTRLLDAAQRLLASDRPNLREEGFRALDVAATRGLPAAQLALGKMHDPQYWREGSPLPHASAPVAAAYYSRAVRGGAADARGELESLCGRMRAGIEGLDTESRDRAVTQYCN